MLGLARYDDSDQEDERMSTSTRVQNDSTLKLSTSASSDIRKSSKAPVKIRRPTRSQAHPRSNNEEPVRAPEPKNRISGTTQHRAMVGSNPAPAQPEEQDEMGEIRALLFPPPIPGVPNWGINAPANTPPNEQLQAKLAEFYRLKHDPDHPRHFNDELMSNRTFRNPHLYAKLVEHVDADERATNFPRDVWDPEDIQPEWFADKIAECQKAVYERQSQSQGPSKRGHIDFAPSKSSKSIQDRDTASSSRSGGLSYGGYENKKTRWR